MKEIVGLPAAIPQPANDFERAVANYLQLPFLRMLVKIVPGLSIAEAGLLGFYEYFRNRRLEGVCNEFTTVGINVSQAEAQRKEFFDAYTSTAQHVLTESREAKIRLFAHLFGEFVQSASPRPSISTRSTYSFWMKSAKGSSSCRCSWSSTRQNTRQRKGRTLYSARRSFGATLRAKHRRSLAWAEICCRARSLGLHAVVCIKK